MFYSGDIQPMSHQVCLDHMSHTNKKLEHMTAHHPNNSVDQWIYKNYMADPVFHNKSMTPLLPSVHLFKSFELHHPSVASLALKTLGTSLSAIHAPFMTLPCQEHGYTSGWCYFRSDDQVSSRPPGPLRHSYYALATSEIWHVVQLPVRQKPRPPEC